MRNASLKGSSRHCPNPTAIKHHFSRCGDVDIHITDEDTICTSCYNAHLEILCESEKTSSDNKLATLLQNSIPVGGKYPDHIAQAIQEVIANVGSVLSSLQLMLPPL